MLDNQARRNATHKLSGGLSAKPLSRTDFGSPDDLQSRLRRPFDSAKAISRQLSEQTPYVTRLAEFLPT